MEYYSTFFIGLIAGIIILRIWDYLYATGAIVLAMKSCIKDSIVMIAKNVQSVYEINNLKYIALEMSDKDEKYVDFQKAMDTRELHSMKNTTIRNFINSIPPKYNHLIPFSDWGTAMDYINAELQKKKGGHAMIIGSDKDKKKKKEKENTTEAPASEETTEEAMGALEQLLGGPQNEIRTIGLMGDVDEEKGGDLMMAILLLTELSGKDAPYDPITMYISTYGGSADEMFGIYDIMTRAKRECEIHTIGVGKVMSAGTLVLASGTKGKRKIGKHCRVMIHSVNSGHVGELHSIENEVKAVKHMQELYINAMAQETSMTKRQLQKLIDRKVNVYLTAEEAIEYGIADEIL